jgi:hypothetical protein
MWAERGNFQGYKKNKILTFMELLKKLILKGPVRGIRRS